MNPIGRINSMTTAGTADIKDKSNEKRKTILTDAETQFNTHTKCCAGRQCSDCLQSPLDGELQQAVSMHLHSSVSAAFCEPWLCEVLHNLP